MNNNSNEFESVNKESVETINENDIVFQNIDCGLKLSNVKVQELTIIEEANFCTCTG